MIFFLCCERGQMCGYVHVCTCMSGEHKWCSAEKLWSLISPCCVCKRCSSLQGSWGKLFQLPPLEAREMRIGRKTTAASQRCLTLQCAMESEPKPKKRKYPSPGLEAFISFSAVPFKELMFDGWRGQNPVSVYSQHWIPIYLIVMTSPRKTGLRVLFWTQIIYFVCVKGYQVHWKEGSRQMNVREFPFLLLPPGGGWRGQAKHCIAPHCSSLEQYVKT